MFDRQLFNEVVNTVFSTNLNYRDYVRFGFVMTDGEWLEKPSDHACFACMRSFKGELKFKYEDKVELTDLSHMIVQPPDGVSLAMTEVHGAWLNFILSYPAWERNVRNLSTGPSHREWEFEVDLKDIPSNTLLSLLGALRYTWAMPWCLVAYYLLVKDKGMNERAAFFLATACSCARQTSLSTSEGYNTGHMINWRYYEEVGLRSFLEGGGCPDPFTFLESGKYAGIMSFMRGSDGGIYGGRKAEHTMPVTVTNEWLETYEQQVKELMND